MDGLFWPLKKEKEVQVYILTDSSGSHGKGEEDFLGLSCSFLKKAPQPSIHIVVVVHSDRFGKGQQSPMLCDDDGGSSSIAAAAASERLPPL